MNALLGGVLLALLAAGYPLYELVNSQQLDGTSALIRGAVVATACTAGVAAVLKLALSYEDQAQRDRTRSLNSLFTDMEGAVAAGTLTAEDDDAPGTDQAAR